MTWITIYDEQGTDHCINAAHIVRITCGEGERPRLFLTNGCIVAYATPNTSAFNEVHQDVLDQISGRA